RLRRTATAGRQRMSRMDFWLAPDTDALQLDTRFVTLYESVLSAESVVSFVSVLTRQRFFRSTARLGADPTTASVSIRHSRRCWEGGWLWQAVRRRDLFLQPTLRSPQSI